MKNRNLNHSDHWATPKYLYNKLNLEFNFDFDPCPLYADFDGLKRDWRSSNFVNPPFRKSYSETTGISKQGNISPTVIARHADGTRSGAYFIETQLSQIECVGNINPSGNGVNGDFL